MERTNLPLARLTAPKHATDLRVGAWSKTGSLTLGGTHLRQRVPCCWKWHSSRLHSSTSRRFARRRSFFKGRDPERVGLSYLGPGLAQPKTHLAEDSLALAYPEHHAIVQAQMLGQELAVPQLTSKTKWRRVSPQIAPQCRPLLGI